MASRKSLSYAELISEFSDLIKTGEASEALKGEIIPGGKLDVTGALDVYWEGYQARVHESLLETFETVNWILGQEPFQLLCHLYTRQLKSESSNIHFITKGFAEFIKQSESLESIPYLYDLARFEQLFSEVFHCKRETLVAVPPETLNETSKFSFIPSFRFFESSHPVYDIWKSRKDNSQPAQNNPAYLTLNKSPDGNIHIHEWNKSEIKFIQELKKGTSLGDVIEKIPLDEPESFFTKFFAAGFVSGV